ncbi:prenyltransferase/squalene oxidase repeat-containing protein [Hymenobacter endophyticus]|uniref:Prenyltransferase/squalene oxidase repeat-containing protein n=1 Tax=Hymenobacter endophyticus TaxID=3076335 RepID=A0ABU3TKZ9_9BACT|nr:prenyltransferase/squalene oxidase repeat-containing protein [Hymenobacter endophyticus]MDU0372052.1 prenyltransferase/squalene oxidase repeat-containing protein [Hymenobacter endophyticus]
MHAQQRTKSDQLFFPDRPAFSRDLVPGALSRCRQQLGASRTPQGRWLDLLTDQADSQYLVTAYAGALLCDDVDRPGLAVEASDSLFPIEQQPGRLLPGVTLALGLRLQKRSSAHQPVATPRAWLDYQDADGGWVAYRDVAALRQQLGGREEQDLSGWTSTHACITALNAWVLREFSACTAAYAASCAWLLTRQEPDGSWPAYWWSSPLFSTAYAVLALGNTPAHHAAVQRASRWLLAGQQADGSWHVQGRPSAYYTALVLQALLAGPDQADSPPLEAAAAWLVSQQMTDGSWPATALLRLPEPAAQQPDSLAPANPSPFGLNVVLVDHNRVLTTAAAYSALRAYYQRQVLQQAA